MRWTWALEDKLAIMGNGGGKKNVSKAVCGGRLYLGGCRRHRHPLAGGRWPTADPAGADPACGSLLGGLGWRNAGAPAQAPSSDRACGYVGAGDARLPFGGAASPRPANGGKAPGPAGAPRCPSPACPAALPGRPPLGVAGAALGWGRRPGPYPALGAAAGPGGAGGLPVAGETRARLSGASTARGGPARSEEPVAALPGERRRRCGAGRGGLRGGRGWACVRGPGNRLPPPAGAAPTARPAPLPKAKEPSGAVPRRGGRGAGGWEGARPSASPGPPPRRQPAGTGKAAWLCGVGRALGWRGPGRPRRQHRGYALGFAARWRRGQQPLPLSESRGAAAGRGLRGGQGRPRRLGRSRLRCRRSG